MSITSYGRVIASKDGTKLRCSFEPEKAIQNFHVPKKKPNALAAKVSNLLHCLQRFVPSYRPERPML